MITKIRRVKGLGIFTDFTWDTAVPDFARYNVIYGWNATGKTTLSCLLAGLATGAVSTYPTLEYEIATDGGAVRHGETFAPKIRVFNQEYVAKNVHTMSGRAKSILILGEENKRIADEIAADEAQVAAKKEQISKLSAELKDAGKQRDRLFSDIAKTIGLNTAGLATRTYRKPDAERDFAALKELALLDDAAVAARALELKQLEKPNVAEPKTPVVSYAGREHTLADVLLQLSTEGASLCAQTVESRVIARLRSHPDIAAWVEQGIALHSAHRATACEFCAQALPADRLALLAAHFNEADKKLKDEIDRLLRHLTQAENAIHVLDIPDKANLYDELQGEYQAAADGITDAAAAISRSIVAFRSAIEAKKTKTTDSLTMEARLDGAALVAALETAKGVIRKHNEKTANFKAAKDAARGALEAHYLSTIYEEVHLLARRIGDTTAEIENITKGSQGSPGDASIRELEDRIKTNRAKISSSHKGCQEINTALRTFLGRDELRFEVEGDGYVLKRGQSVAQGLSEGERTAIGVCHFIINLRDDFDPGEGIIVVDDPVSSLDSNSIFQAFAFLKNAVKEAKQVFFLTHDCDFLRLLINWVKNSRQPAAYYMITDVYDASGARCAIVTTLDKLLQEHESEYHYLFKRLYTFQSDGTIMSVYDMPNIARKVLESFLMFRVPSSESLYRKMESLKPHFDENKLTAIYKFVNDQSHITGKGFDPALVGETKKNVKYLLEMIEAVFPEHYKILVESITSA